MSIDPQADAIALVDAFHAAVNRHDVEGALACFTADASAQFPNQSVRVVQGTAELRQWLEEDAARNIHVSVERVQVEADRVTWTAKVVNDSLRPLGITFAGLTEVTVHDGKITAFRFTLDDATLEKLRAIPTQTSAE
jgi:ketosteroid isomerase-like protein